MLIGIILVGVISLYQGLKMKAEVCFMEAIARKGSSVSDELEAAKTKLLNPKCGDNILEDVPIDRILPNPYQPRRIVTEIEELASSIKEVGVLEPIIVRQVEGESGEVMFQLIAGQRRLKACQELGMETIPAIIKDVVIANQKAFALIENMQRVDLPFFDLMNGIAGLQEDLGDAVSIAKSLGKSDRYVRGILKCHNDVNSINDFKRLFEVGKRNLDRTTAMKFSEIADDLIKVQTKNNRQYKRYVEKVTEDGLKNGILAIYDKIKNSKKESKKAKNHIAGPLFLENEKELVLHIRIAKSAMPDESKMAVIQESVKAFLDKIDSHGETT